MLEEEERKHDKIIQEPIFFQIEQKNLKVFKLHVMKNIGLYHVSNHTKF